jgi:hypothetical protein
MEQNNRNKETDPDVRPSKGQESNENWDDNREKGDQTNVSHRAGSERTTEQSNTSGYGSSQKSERGNVGPLDADLEKLPSEKRRESGTGVE